MGRELTASCSLCVQPQQQGSCRVSRTSGRRFRLLLRGQMKGRGQATKLASGTAHTSKHHHSD